MKQDKTKVREDLSTVFEAFLSLVDVATSCGVAIPTKILEQGALARVYLLRNRRRDLFKVMRNLAASTDKELLGEYY